MTAMRNTPKDHPHRRRHLLAHAAVVVVVVGIGFGAVLAMVLLAEMVDRVVAS